MPGATLRSTCGCRRRRRDCGGDVVAAGEVEPVTRHLPFDDPRRLRFRVTLRGRSSSAHPPVRFALAQQVSWPCGQDLESEVLAVTDEATAERFYQRFKWDVIAPIEADRWALDSSDSPRLAGVGGGGDGRRRAPDGGGELSARRLLGAHLPAASPERRETGGGGVPGLPDAVRVPTRFVRKYTVTPRGRSLLGCP